MTPDEANLRCLDGSVRNLIAMLCRHDGSVLRDCIPSTGTISGDLYATVASVVHNYWDHYTLSDLQRRYPLPKPVDAAPAGNDGGRELPSVPREVSDGGGSAEHRGVCGSADVEPPVTREPWAPESAEDLLKAFPEEIGKLLSQARADGAAAIGAEFSSYQEVMMGALKSRERIIKSLQAQVDQLARHIAFKAAK